MLMNPLNYQETNTEHDLGCELNLNPSRNKGLTPRSWLNFVGIGINPEEHERMVTDYEYRLERNKIAEEDSEIFMKMFKVIEQKMNIDQGMDYLDNRDESADMS